MASRENGIVQINERLRVWLSRGTWGDFDFCEFVLQQGHDFPLAGAALLFVQDFGSSPEFLWISFRELLVPGNPRQKVGHSLLRDVRLGKDVSGFVEYWE